MSARELAIVLALSFGYAGVQSIITILRRLSQETALASQTATINRPLAEQPLFDLAYQLLGFVGELAPVALVAYLQRLGRDVKAPQVARRTP